MRRKPRLKPNEKDLADTMAHKFLAVSTEARLAENFQIEKAEQLQQDQDQHKDAAVLARDQKELDASATKAKEMKLDAAQKAADAAAFAAGVHLLSPGQITGPNLFQNAEVTNYSGKDPKHASTDSQCDTILPYATRNPNDMFRGSHGSPCRATVFEDGQQVGFQHFIEWKTPSPVTVKSVGLFAAHDAIRYRRSFETFKFYVKNQTQWAEVKEYSPALMYGGSCGVQPCFPPPASKYAPGTVLAACINVPPTTGQEFRAVFIQSVSSVEQFSGPRVLQLSGYPNANCAK
jgi:hypothetical protein